MKSRTGLINKMVPLYLLVAFIVSAVICVTALRQNNQHMIVLKNAVYQADQKGTEVNAPLQALRNYVYAHMNTELSSGPNSVYPPIQLKFTYQRLQTAAAQQTNNANAQVYTDAQHFCEAQNSVSFSGRSRVGCVEQYIQQHQQKIPTVPAALYEFDFVSPSWSPDLAGWSLLTSVILLILLALSLIYIRFASIFRKFFSRIL